MKKSITLSEKKYRKTKNPEILYLFYKTVAISVICGKCQNKHKRIFKEVKVIWK